MSVLSRGINTVEREGLSVSHACRATLIAAFDPTERDLPPHLMERFGLCVAVTAPGPTLGDRLDAVDAAMDYQDGPTLYSIQYGQATRELQARVVAAAARLAAPGGGPTGRGPAISRRQVRA